MSGAHWLETTALQLLHALLMVAAAPALTGVVRLVKSRLTGKRGAPIWQPYRDLWRLLRKEAVVAETASWLFRVAPYMTFAAIWLGASLIPAFTTDLLLGPTADLIALVALLGGARFFTALAGLDVGTSFGGIGTSRESMIASLAEPAMLMVIFTVSLLVGTTSLPHIATTLLDTSVGLRVSLALGLVAITMVAIAENARVPVDNPATHLELTMVHEAMVLEYSGRHLALVEAAAMLKLLLYMSLIACIFAPSASGSCCGWARCWSAPCCSGCSRPRSPRCGCSGSASSSPRPSSSACWRRSSSTCRRGCSGDDDDRGGSALPPDSRRGDRQVARGAVAPDRRATCRSPLRGMFNAAKSKPWAPMTDLEFDIAHLLSTSVLVLSFALLFQRRIFGVLKSFALQAGLLAAAAAWQALVQDAPHLYITAGIAFLFKAIAIPVALHYIVVKMQIHRTVETVFGVGPTMIIGVGLVALSILLVLPVTYESGAITRENLALALSVVLLGLLMMITRRNAVTQVIGFMSLENGLILAAVGVRGMPFVVEMSVAFSVMVAFIIFGVFFFHIRERFDTLDLHYLETFRGERE